MSASQQSAPLQGSSHTHILDRDRNLFELLPDRVLEFLHVDSLSALGIIDVLRSHAPELLRLAGQIVLSFCGPAFARVVLVERRVVVQYLCVERYDVVIGACKILSMSAYEDALWFTT